MSVYIVEIGKFSLEYDHGCHNFSVYSKDDKGELKLLVYEIRCMPITFWDEYSREVEIIIAASEDTISYHNDLKPAIKILQHRIQAIRSKLLKKAIKTCKVHVCNYCPQTEHDLCEHQYDCRLRT